ncbi:uncharacterized protein LOC126456115 [Schistocerca serialis cubense]|uniref:uncharacterized protein LOC126456115 n=1 Tax=Schistocerca serialis cubense TaxID=2023355 RepID=UPI00214E0392|nr:uncharacterized protein LOC126456115 [Schistocerca serialis cubense]
MEPSTEKRNEMPSWMDNKFIEEAFLKAGNEVDSDTARIEYACKYGGGLMSETFRLRAKLRGQSAGEPSLVVKSALRSEGAMKDLGSSDVFSRERAVYCDVLPALAAEGGSGGGAWAAVAPACYGSGAPPGPDYLLLDDLSAAGFWEPQAAPLDRAQCAAALAAAARLHAGSVPQLPRPPLDGPLFRQSLTFADENAAAVGGLVQSSLLRMGEVLAEYPWFHPYDQRFQKLARELYPRAARAVKECSGGLRVLLHGDLKRNNIMFRTAAGELQVRLYDFQCAHVGCPAEDVVYLLYSSASLEVLQHHVDELVAGYHASLQAALRALGLHQAADDFPLHQLTSDMERMAPVKLFCTFQSMPLLISQHCIDFDPNVALADNDDGNVKRFIRQCITNPTFLCTVQYLIPVFEERGWI